MIFFGGVPSLDCHRIPLFLLELSGQRRAGNTARGLAVGHGRATVVRPIPGLNIGGSLSTDHGRLSQAKKASRQATGDSWERAIGR